MVTWRGNPAFINPLRRFLCIYIDQPTGPKNISEAEYRRTLTEIFPNELTNLSVLIVHMYWLQGSHETPWTNPLWSDNIAVERPLWISHKIAVLSTEPETNILESGDQLIS